MELRFPPLTGHQIREARLLLGLSPSQLASKVACITALGVTQAEKDEDGSTLSEGLSLAFRQTLERLGIEFTRCEEPGMRLREGGQATGDRGR